MSKKPKNQNTNFEDELINSVESNFIFDKKPINRFNYTNSNFKPENKDDKIDKTSALAKLKEEINSIEDCSLKKNSKKIIVGDGNINSPIVLIGGTPGIEEDKTGLTFMGESGELLKKMLLAINIKKEKIYSTYAVNFRPPEDRKPSTIEIKKYSQFLQKHILIIKPKIIILMGSTAMESLTGLNSKISMERGRWKNVIIGNTNYDTIITFNPSYLLRVPENKKHSWNDLKKIKQKIIDLKLTI
jgi:uracil-DNA glycosylase|tara:strand:- start:179 stop:910 length:732 start_codon:yes stop_codon:yes gene_type:complete